jgi:hypothetical protein
MFSKFGFISKGISDTLSQSADLRYHKTRTKSSIASNEETFDDAAKSSNPSAFREISDARPHPDYVTIEQEDEPLNDFEQNDYWMYSAFLHLFPLGRGLRNCSGMANLLVA